MPSPHDILQRYWGYDTFRPLQEEIITSIIAGRDTLALLPTGGGKSLCFQVPGLALPGLTLVISPLIALMRDQVEHLNRRHIPATFINSSLSWREIDTKLQGAMDGKYKFLYLAPERIETDIFLERLRRMSVSLIAVDEAHCISHWGYDFRPSYLRISTLRQHLPRVPIAAFTATAPPPVQTDIIDRLELRTPARFTQSFRRTNLSYRVIPTENVGERILQLIRNTPGSGIIYARTRKSVQSLANLLQREGIPAAAYHAGLPSKERTQVQSAWIDNTLRIVAATNAFGMGIDKPDVRFVLHLNLPADLESYYQEAGRAGRDGKPCVAVAFKNSQDISELQQWVEDKYPTWDQLNTHYLALCEYFSIPNTTPPDTAFPLDTAAIAKRFSLHPLRLHNSIRLLDAEGVLSLNERPEDYAYTMLTVLPEHILDYKRRFPDKAPLLDHLLRTFGGEVYSDEVRFLPSNWAKKLGIEEATLIHQFEQLATRGILSFKPPVAHPTIRFLQPRQRLHKQALDWDRYTFLTQQSRERLAQVLEYIDPSSETCRSRFLEQYFGENTTQDCGICDTCRTRAAGSLDPQRIQQSHDAILAATSNIPTDIRPLLDSIPIGTSPQRLEVLRRMLDQGLLIRTGPLQIRRP